jgi:perosamine synthetase
VVQLDLDGTNLDRNTVFSKLREAEIGVNVHYIPVHLHPFYRKRFDTHPGMCPVAERAYERIISLPMYPALAHEDQHHVIETLGDILS